MKIQPIKTPVITLGGPNLINVTDTCLPPLPHQAVVAVSSKIVSICEGTYISEHATSKARLIRQEADYYRQPGSNPYRYSITIKSNILSVAAGVDYVSGHYIPWPKDPQGSANRLRRHLTKQAGHPVGVIITDSRSTPLRRGALGFALAYSGFAALTHYAGRTDVFGRTINLKVANHADALAAAAVAVMGEGAECTPFALIEDLSFIHFQNRNPTPTELTSFKLTATDDIFAELYQSVPWDKQPPRD